MAHARPACNRPPGGLYGRMARADAQTPAHSSAPPALTPARRRVLDALRAEGRAVGAYDILDRLTASTGKRVAPISVYRALDWLRDQGLVHRLASRNAYLACGHSHGSRETVVFLICDSCRRVSEATSPPLADALAGLAAERDFEGGHEVVEIAGRCAACRAA